MKLIENAGRIAAASLSFWMNIIGLLVLVAPEVYYAETGIDTDARFLWWAGLLLLVGSNVGRMIKQELPLWREMLRWLGIGLALVLIAWVATGANAMSSLNAVKDKPPVEKTVPQSTTEQATLDLAVPFIAEEEGTVLTAYQDIVGVWTICAGSTRGVKPGMKKTRAECEALLRREVAEYRERLHEYFTVETKTRRLPPKRDTAYTSLAFNVGVAGAGKSTATRRLNAGNIRGGCEAIGWWNKAGKRVIRGLVNRRARETALCLDGL